jgi:hypothetical protein
VFGWYSITCLFCEYIVLVRRAAIHSYIIISPPPTPQAIDFRYRLIVHNKRPANRMAFHLFTDKTDLQSRRVCSGLTFRNLPTDSPGNVDNAAGQ